MLGYLKRLATTGAAYQAADVVSRVFALVTLPLYLSHVTEADYGVSEIVVTWVVLLSIPLRLGLGEAIVRFWFLDEDPEHRRRARRPRRSSGSARSPRWSRWPSPGRSRRRCSTSATASSSASACSACGR